MADSVKFSDIPIDIQKYIFEIVEKDRLDPNEFKTLYRLSYIFRPISYSYISYDYITYLFFFTFLKYCLLMNKLYFIDYDIEDRTKKIFKVTNNTPYKLDIMSIITKDLMTNVEYSKKYFDPPAIIFDIKLMRRASNNVRIDLDRIGENTYITNRNNVVIDISLTKNNDNYTLIPNNEPIPVPKYDGVINFSNILTSNYPEYLKLLEQIDPVNKENILKHITDMDIINNDRNSRPQASTNIGNLEIWRETFNGGNNIYYINSNNNIAYINYSNKKINFYQTENKIYIIIDKKKIYITKKIFGYNKELNKYFIKL